MPGVSDIRTEDGKALQQGSMLLFQARQATHRSQVEAYDPPRRLVLLAKQGNFQARYSYTLSEADGGTQLTLQVDCKGSGMMALVSPLIAALVWRTDRAQVERFKTTLLAAES